MNTLIYKQKTRRFSSKSCRIVGRSDFTQHLLPEEFNPYEMAKLIQKLGRARCANEAARKLKGGLIKETILSLVSQTNEFNPIYLVSVQGAFLGEGLNIHWDVNIIREYHFSWKELVWALKDETHYESYWASYLVPNGYFVRWKTIYGDEMHYSGTTGCFMGRKTIFRDKRSSCDSELFC